jgi:methionyl-tRNA formyltransferase
MSISLILAGTLRSKRYVNELFKNKIFPKKIIFYSKSKDKEFLKKIEKFNIKFKFFYIKDINNKNIIKEILKTSSEYFLYSGYPGEIIKSNILEKKKIIHCHPGLLPNFRGSTVMYYSLILSKKIYCSCIQLNKKIDEGKILFIQKFKKPKNLYTLEKNFDNNVRAKTLISFLKKKKRFILKKKSASSNYYIAHPLIRQIVLNRKSLEFIKDIKLKND